mgnify:CR=1 FL=1
MSMPSKPYCCMTATRVRANVLRLVAVATWVEKCLVGDARRASRRLEGQAHSHRSFAQREPTHCEPVHPPTVYDTVTPALCARLTKSRMSESSMPA